MIYEYEKGKVAIEIDKKLKYVMKTMLEKCLDTIIYITSENGNIFTSDCSIEMNGTSLPGLKVEAGT